MLHPLKFQSHSLQSVVTTVVLVTRAATYFGYKYGSGLLTVPRPEPLWVLHAYPGA